MYMLAAQNIAKQLEQQVVKLVNNVREECKYKTQQLLQEFILQPFPLFVSSFSKCV